VSCVGTSKRERGEAGRSRMGQRVLWINEFCQCSAHPGAGKRMSIPKPKGLAGSSLPPGCISTKASKKNTHRKKPGTSAKCSDRMRKTHKAGSSSGNCWWDSSRPVHRCSKQGVNGAPGRPSSSPPPERKN